ncbi:hypothetical protein TUM19329_25920 [Legionella antarctica]|uniref:Uncharacterized protein n=1 Tax=Legionella antarctica TaxID=2708020 RepID=A0A6F8T703_9GAMM|nr:hypothetical protein [Legionella antarctica]BCA96231.1 hypothetical protein TUM19329_25920 [Legionella antarctica]
MLKMLNTIAEDYEEFDKRLKDGYRGVYRKQLNITEELFTHIRSGLDDVNGLLACVNQKIASSSTSSRETQEFEIQPTSMDSSQNKKRKSSTLEKADKNPVQPIKRRASHNHSVVGKTSEKNSEVVIAEPSSTSQRIETSGMEGHQKKTTVSMDTSCLKMLSSLASQIFTTPEKTSPVKDPDPFELAPPSPPPSFSFWSQGPTVNPALDSTIAYQLLNEWKLAALRKRSPMTSQNEKAFCFEKLGHCLLIAATKLQKSNSSVMHPALRTSIQFLCKSGELYTHNFDPINTLYSLSKKYADLLKNFNCFLNKRPLTQKEYLSCLKKQMRDQTLLGLNQVSEEEAVKNLFTSLAGACSYEEYSIIKETCCESLRDATTGLSISYQ